MAALEAKEETVKSGESRDIYIYIPRGTGEREMLSEREAEADWTELHTPESALQKLDIAASIFALFPLFSWRVGV